MLTLYPGEKFLLYTYTVHFLMVNRIHSDLPYSHGVKFIFNMTTYINLKLLSVVLWCNSGSLLETEAR